MDAFSIDDAMKIFVISLLIVQVIGQSAKITSSPEVKIKGQVFSSEIVMLLHDAEVTILDHDRVLGQAKTNQDGIYEIPNILPGKYLLRVLLAGFRESKFPIEALSRKELIVDVPLEVGELFILKRLPRKVEGFVRNELSYPIPDATVILFDAHKRKVVVRTKSDIRGYFYFHLKDYHQVVLYALKDDHLLGATTSTMQDHAPVTIVAAAS